MGTTVIATHDMRQINNSVSRNRPKTDTYPKHYLISKDLYAAAAPGPNLGILSSWIRTTSSSRKPMIKKNIVFRPLAIDISRVWDQFSVNSRLELRRLWLRFSEYSNRPIDVESLVPPENVYHESHGHICKCDNFEMGDWKVFDGPCNTLRCKPRSSE